MKRLALHLAIAAVWGAAGAASACVVLSRPSDVVYWKYDAVLTATVTEVVAWPTDEGVAWRASGLLNETIEGEAHATVYEFIRTGYSASCDDGMAPPALGEVWVLYLQKIDDRWWVARSYPLYQMLEIDPRLRQAGDR